MSNDNNIYFGLNPETHYGNTALKCRKCKLEWRAKKLKQCPHCGGKEFDEIEVKEALLPHVKEI